MRVCIVGAGAIGGWLGARLAAGTDARVGAVARGATLGALDAHGWRLLSGDELVSGPVLVSDRPAALGEQDLVIITVKGYSLPSLAPSLTPLLGPSTVVLPFMNGVPWWFGEGTVLAGEPLEAVDPGGRIGATLPTSSVLGGVVHASCSVVEPGLVRHVMGNGLIVGEPAGGGSERVEQVRELLRAAGFDVTVSADVRTDIWYKLWGNMTMNPVSALTGATADLVLADPQVREFSSGAMREAAAIGARIGCPIDQTPEDRHAITVRLGAFKTSMLQDVEAGRPIELDALVGVVHELGERLGVPTPNVSALLGLTRVFARAHGL